MNLGTGHQIARADPAAAAPHLRHLTAAPSPPVLGRPMPGARALAPAAAAAPVAAAAPALAGAGRVQAAVLRRTLWLGMPLQVRGQPALPMAAARAPAAAAAAAVVAASSADSRGTGPVSAASHDQSLLPEGTVRHIIWTMCSKRLRLLTS